MEAKSVCSIFKVVPIRFRWLLAKSQTDFIGRPLSLLWEDLPNISPSEATTRDEAAFTLYSILIYTGVLP